MKLPSKITSYSDSVLSKLQFLLGVLDQNDIGISSLYKQTQIYFSGIGEYLDALDCLYALGKIELDEERGTIHYVT